MNHSISIIGGGNLGIAIATGLYTSLYTKPENIYVTRRNLKPLEPLKAFGININSDNSKAIQKSGIIILSVKPFQLKEVLENIKPHLDPKQHILVSCVTGVSTFEILQILAMELPVFRAMPNTAIAIMESMTCISSHNATKEQDTEIENLFGALGLVTIIEEKLMEAATVLAACGTAFSMRYIRASIQGGIEIGFSAEVARLIAAQTTKGAAELLLQKGNHPEEEIDKVTTPKGCTIAGLNEMEHQGFSSSLIKGISTSFKKITTD